MTSKLVSKISENIQDLLPLQILYFDAYGNIPHKILDNTGVLGNCTTLFDRIHPEDRQKLQDIIDILEMDKCSSIEFLRVKSRSTDKYRWLEVIVCKEKYKDKTLFRWVATDVGMLQTKIDYHKSGSQLQRALIDIEPQTRLLNERALWQGVRDWLLLNSGLRVGVLLVNVEEIQEVKGFWGQEYANRQGSRVGELLQSSIRKADIVASEGGRKIIIAIFEEEGRGFSPTDVRKRLLKIIDGDDSISVKVSIGIKSFGADKFHKQDDTEWLSLWKKELEVVEQRDKKTKLKDGGTLDEY